MRNSSFDIFYIDKQLSFIIHQKWYYQFYYYNLDYLSARDQGSARKYYRWNKENKYSFDLKWCSASKWMLESLSCCSNWLSTNLLAPGLSNGDIRFTTFFVNFFYVKKFLSAEPCDERWYVCFQLQRSIYVLRKLLPMSERLSSFGIKYFILKKS